MATRHGPTIRMGRSSRSSRTTKTVPPGCSTPTSTTNGVSSPAIACNLTGSIGRLARPIPMKVTWIRTSTRVG
ncbi:hypothetical protein [Lysobacter gummosus]|uniref:hypothetical protein n=1 Tax=Lysobacter gummosus TaxID=262324 RepID=UPI003643C9A2